ncbi:MAG TPA: restriction endonuclease subunit S [Alistipes finegoldii]|uniref:restriction endonuclease subunit S n=3 Tax=Alistipes finegoldii TaxID=214856 RepID=UPI001D73AD8A|nr:restriction endonuclease subunit S [Alistipes finegoldii]HJG73483.1 restriction endonuclease subunit S [Alistipes finegoldii]
MRFPEFSGEWEEEQLDSIATLSKGIGISKEQLSEDGEPCILYGELYTKYKSEIIKQVESKTDIDCSKLKRSKANDVIIPCSGETAVDIATARCVPFDNILLGGDLNIISLHKYDGAFMSYQLNGKRKYDIARVAQGVSVVHLYGEHLKAIKTYNPSLPEQQKIAKLLSLIDERIATQNKIIEKLQSLIKGLNDNIHKGIKGETVCFSDLGEAYSGLSGKGGDDFGYGEPFITYMNVHQNTYISEKDYELVQIVPNEKQNSVQYSDALFTLSSETPEEVGIGAVYLGNTQKLYLNSFCFGIHFYDERVLPQYLAHFISSSSFRKAIYPLAQGSTRFNLQKKDFMKMKFLLPSLEKQGRIANTLDALHCRLANEKSLMEQYILLKKYLLSQMFI